MTRFLDRETRSRAAVLGFAAGLATLSKFTAVLLLPACAGALVLWRWYVPRRSTQPPGWREFLPSWRRLGVVALSAMLTVWAGYRFAIGPITQDTARPHTAIDRLVGSSGRAHDVAYDVAESFVVPAPAFFHGLAEVSNKNARGHEGYLLGHTRQTGWWYYFPVAIGVKTPLPFLFLIAVGAVYMLRESRRELDWVAAAPVIAAAAILLVCLPSHVNIGLRYILPIYPPLAVVGGVGAWRLWRAARSRAVAAAVVALITWQVVASVRAHPDYLAYFNELASRHPENVLVDSDLDWGQDLWRLSAVLKEQHIDSVSLVYAGSPQLDLTQFGLPPFRVLKPYEQADGWVAISLLRLKAGGLGFPVDGFSWLDTYKPQYRAGPSIWIFHVPDQIGGEAGSRTR
jgi:4-amino-4-deoxy-L-arabinose transferase-like glycosyltransferase